MAENTKIEWAHHSFNSWEGCAKVSPGCKYCYAESQHRFLYSALGKNEGPGTCWGISAPRLARSADNWKKPLKWNRTASEQRVRFRVFCASMADVFEQQSELSRAFAGLTAEVPTGKAKQTRTVTFANLDEERIQLFALISVTPQLDWLLLTKRPEAIMATLKRIFRLLCEPDRISTTDKRAFNLLEKWVLDERPPHNVWLGTSVENQAEADARIPHLVRVPAVLHFLSCEPLLSAVDLTPYLAALSWVIVGGESGPHSRPIHPDWVRSLQQQCQQAQVSFFFKQWGEAVPQGQLLGDDYGHSGHQPWLPADGTCLWRVGKKHAGRQLDGQLYDGVADPLAA
ncbi:DUF5131 family protein [Hymenobacter guriensis]|uniref:Phage Gp37/Gp68 family protein n=1 Tax=Hymenobacter guriensis TaxID=2793065 RepID=A0ABS0L6S4_9BACT|nr:phage Gp37/Gp68 family protein [Hymenobacter guriensis]MBG8555062.1 phage Gp37/Gp68 family protein [Hymenobacter guriensis]